MAKKNGNGKSSGFEAKVAKVIQQAQALAQAIEALELTALNDDERKHSMGRLRTGEADAIETLFDVADRFPAVFASLADKDGGTNPSAVETQPARASLARIAVLAPLVPILEGALVRVADGMSAEGQTAKELSVAIYAIARAVAPTDSKLRSALAPASSYYGGPARKRAASVKRGKKAAATA